MYEKILQKLKDQRGENKQVTDQTLETKAKTLEKLITSDEILSTVDFTEEIKSMQGNIGHVAAEAVKNVKSETKPTPPATPPVETKPTKKEEDMPAWAKELMEQNKALNEQVLGIKTEKVTQSRGEILNGILKETPDIYREATLKGFNRMQFATDEDFTAYAEEIKADAKVAIQVGQEKGLNTHAPSSNPKPVDKEEVSPDMQKAIEGLTAKKSEGNKPF